MNGLPLLGYKKDIGLGASLSSLFHEMDVGRD
jgi:hypothetical protein